MTSQEMVQNSKGVYVPKSETSEELAKTMATLILELNSQKISRKTPSFFGMSPDLILRKGIDSKIKGLEKISGIDENIMISLEEPLDYKLLADVVEKNSSYYMWADETIFGTKIPQVKQEGHLWTLGFPIVALTEAYDGNDIIEIPKGHLNIFYGSRILSRYLKNKHEEFTLK